MLNITETVITIARKNKIYNNNFALNVLVTFF